MIVPSEGDQGRLRGQKGESNAIGVFQTDGGATRWSPDQEEGVAEGAASKGDDGPTQDGGDENVGGGGN